MKIKFSPFVQSASGSMGDMVFYELNGVPTARRKGVRTKPPTAGQLAHRERVKAAAAWSRKTMADPRQRAEYAASCQGHQTPYNLGVRDFLTSPVVESIDLAGYTGKVGDVLKFKIWDDFDVKAVTVVIHDAESKVVEEGLAVRGNEAKDWQYVAKTQVSQGKSVQIEVTAEDRPGNKAQLRQWQYFQV
jgi:hypothetical protein